MTDKPDLSWYPTTIEELQRLLASGVWPRVRAIADAGPFHRVQGLLTRIDTDGGMNGIWEGSASAGVVPIDSIWLQRYPTTGETGVGARSLWLWRAEATEPAKREHTMVLRLDKPPRFEQSASIEKALGLLPLIEEALAKLERRIDGVRSWPEHVRWLDIAGPIRSWCAEIRCSGTRDLTLVAAVYDAVGKLALDVDKLDHVRVANAAGSIAREAAGKYSNDALATVKLRAALTAAASSMARFPGPTPEEIKEPELDMPPSVAGVDFCVVELDGGGWRMEASCDDPEGPLGLAGEVRGEERNSKAESVVDAWEYAFGLRTSQMLAERKNPPRHHEQLDTLANPPRIAINLSDRAHFVLTDIGAARWNERVRRTPFASLCKPGSHSCRLWELARNLGPSMYDGAQPVIENCMVEVDVQPSDVGKISLGKMERERDAEAEVERLADYLLRHHASECTGPGSGVSAVDVVIRLLKRAGDFESRRLDLARCSDALRRIAAASNLMVLGMRGPEFAMELAERVEKQLALLSPVLRTDDEQADRALALDRLTAYMRINHAHSLSLGEHVADVAIWALEKYAKDHRLLCEQLGLLPANSPSRVRRAIKEMKKDIDDASERLAKWCPECDPGKTSLRGVIVLLEVDVLKPNAEALDRVASASGWSGFQALRTSSSAATVRTLAPSLAERVEQQFADFRKIADRLNTDREIAGAAEQLVRRLVDRLVETDPEYIEQLRRSGS